MKIFILMTFLISNISMASNEALSTDEAEKTVANMTQKDGEDLSHRCLKEEDMVSCQLFSVFALIKLNDVRLYRLAAGRACKLGHAESCQIIISEDREGDDIRNKCEKGVVDSCALYSKGRRVMYDDLEGELIYAAEACNLGHKKSCEIIEADKKKVKNKKGNSN